jgi:hypothetical protein
MEMQQMMERLLAKMDANQAKAEANREQMLAKIRVDRKANREELKGIMDVNTKSIVRAFHEKMDACVASRRDD